MKKKINIARHFSLRFTVYCLLFAVYCLYTNAAYAQSYDQYIEAGIKAADHEAYAEAEECFRQALRLSPDDYRNALLYANMARVQQAQGKNQKAL